MSAIIITIKYNAHKLALLILISRVMQFYLLEMKSVQALLSQDWIGRGTLR